MIRIAVVEDEEYYVNQLTGYLNEYQKTEKEELDITVYRDGDAVTAEYKSQFDIILMDIQMPVMNVLEATHRIRESARDDLRALPIVVLSANAFTEDVQESKRAGADDHLSKPISIKDLAATLGGILGRA